MVKVILKICTFLAVQSWSISSILSSFFFFLCIPRSLPSLWTPFQQDVMVYFFPALCQVDGQCFNLLVLSPFVADLSSFPSLCYLGNPAVWLKGLHIHKFWTFGSSSRPAVVWALFVIPRYSFLFSLAKKYTCACIYSHFCWGQSPENLTESWWNLVDS